ncbi:MAG: response regulator [Anaerolineales bacterium]|nr:response regulator [Anaerolineales bacterium]
MQSALASDLHRSASPQSASKSSPFVHSMGAKIPLTILLAEDNPTNQKVTLHLLARLGYHAEAAADGYQVLEALQRKRFDVVLMDIHMPEMDGLEATRRIRADTTREQPTIYALTAAATPEDAAACRAAGMDGYLTKPLQLAQLVGALRTTAEQKLQAKANHPLADT